MPGIDEIWAEMKSQAKPSSALNRNKCSIGDLGLLSRQGIILSSWIVSIDFANFVSNCDVADVTKRDDSNRVIETAELKEGLLDPKFLSGNSKIFSCR
jgi:hypothetical protein